MKTKSKIISLIMALALVISSMPFVAFAEETDFDLATAIENAVDGGTITLTSNANIIGEIITIPGGKELTIDLAGYTITAGNGDDDNIGLSPYAKLTIKDSVGTGSIESTTGNVGGRGVIDVDGADFVLESGSIIATNTDGAHQNAITVYDDGVTNQVSTVTINGGYVKATSSAVSNHNTMGGATAITVNGGVLDSGIYSTYTATPADHTVTITGGTVAGVTMGGSDYSNNTAVSKLTISGGTVGYIATNIYGDGVVQFDITGGTFDADPTDYLADGYTVDYFVNSGYYVMTTEDYYEKMAFVDAQEAITNSVFEIDQATANTVEEVTVIIEAQIEKLMDENVDYADSTFADSPFVEGSLRVYDFVPAVTDGTNGSFSFMVQISTAMEGDGIGNTGVIIASITPSVPSTETAGESVVTPSISAESQATLVEEAGFTTAQIESGAELKVELSVNDKEEVTDDEQTSIDEAIEAYEGDLEVALVLDIDLTKYVGGVADGNITTLTTPIEITIDLPEKLQGKDLVIIRVHELSDGSLETDVIKDEDTDDKTFTFSTDKFSTYALAEVTTVTATATPEPTATPDADVDEETDEETTETPETGDNSNVALAVILMMTAFSCGVVVLRRRLVK